MFDCTKTKDYLIVKSKMCEYYRSCEACGLLTFCGTTNETEKVDQMIQITQDWVDSYETWLEKLNARLPDCSYKHEPPYDCPQAFFGDVAINKECPSSATYCHRDACAKCWARPCIQI